MEWKYRIKPSEFLLPSWQNKPHINEQGTMVLLILILNPWARKNTMAAILCHFNSAGNITS